MNSFSCPVCWRLARGHGQVHSSTLELGEMLEGTSAGWMLTNTVMPTHLKE